jgi:hypothetical protein
MTARRSITMRSIRTTVDIDATSDVAWQVLTAFDSYSQWNPFIPHVAGAATVGSRLTVQLTPPGGRSMTFRPTVTEVQRGRVLEWLGRLGLPGLFDGLHRFELESLPDGRSRLTQSESFRGLLVPVLWRSVHGPTAAGFAQFNDAFATRCLDVSRLPVESATNHGPPEP